ncbi:MAG: glycosyltransferase family 9 protein [Nitrospira sp.]|nr:glycosyltransferase family 9 protein [Nitrospira sp.]
MADYRRILIIKPSSLGDVVHALPTLAALRDRFPLAHIVWLVKQQWAGIVERAEGLDEVWPVPPSLSGWLSLVPRLRAADFDLVVDLQGLFRSGAMGWLSGSPARIGFANGREGSPVFYTKLVSVPTQEMHAVDRYLLVAAALGAFVHGAPAFRLRPLPADRETVGALLGRHGVSAKTAWVAVNVSARWQTKRWPAPMFAAALDRLNQEGLGPVVLIGGPDEKSDVGRVMGQMKTAAVDLTGETTPGLLPALLQSASLLLTNDSGPMHVAAAVGTPVVALFGPTSPVRTGPYGQSHRVLRSGVACSPCFSRHCRNGLPLECLTSISVEQVLEAVRAQAARRPVH